jgi:glycosyltransferase involved in cell wall biosynthesis
LYRSQHAPRDKLSVAFIGGRGIGRPYSGIETYYEQVGSRLAAFGHEVLVYCRTHFTPRDVDPRGMRVVLQPCVRTKHGESLSHTLLCTADVMRRSVDIVQFHALGPSLFAAIPRLHNVCTVASIRGLDWRREKWAAFAKGFLRFCEDMSCRLPHAVSVVSRSLQAYYRGQHAKDVTYIPNGVSLEPAPPVHEIRALGLAGGDYLLFMGRISPEKGCDVLIEAFRRLGRKVKLVIAGHSSYTDAYVERLRGAAPPGVIFPGPVTGRLRAELYGHAAAFVLPSTIEGLSVALLEAMSFGLCAVTSDIPENREVIDGVGWTAPPGDADGLASILRRVVDQPGEAGELGRLARKRIEAEYTWDQVARRTEAFYYEVLARRGQSSLATRGSRAA